MLILACLLISTYFICSSRFFKKALLSRRIKLYDKFYKEGIGLLELYKDNPEKQKNAMERWARPLIKDSYFSARKPDFYLSPFPFDNNPPSYLEIFKNRLQILHSERLRLGRIIEIIDGVFS